MDFEAILSRFNARRNGPNEYLASCPARGHGKGRGDKNPSLAISQGAKGETLIHCHAGCPTQDVLGAVGLEPKDLYPSQQSRGSTKKSSARKSSARKSSGTKPVEREWRRLQEAETEETSKALFRFLHGVRGIPEETIKKAVDQGNLVGCGSKMPDVELLNRFYAGKEDDRPYTAAFLYERILKNGKLRPVAIEHVGKKPFMRDASGKPIRRATERGHKASEGFFSTGINLERAREIILCEGPINGLSISTARPQAAVLAIGGASQAKKVVQLKPFISGKRVVMYFDNDEGGRNAAMTALRILGND